MMHFADGLVLRRSGGEDLSGSSGRGRVFTLACTGALPYGLANGARSNFHHMEYWPTFPCVFAQIYFRCVRVRMRGDECWDVDGRIAQEIHFQETKSNFLH